MCRGIFGEGFACRGLQEGRLSNPTDENSPLPCASLAPAQLARVTQADLGVLVLPVFARCAVRKARSSSCCRKSSVRPRRRIHRKSTRESLPYKATHTATDSRGPHERESKGVISCSPLPRCARTTLRARKALHSIAEHRFELGTVLRRLSAVGTLEHPASKAADPPALAAKELVGVGQGGPTTAAGARTHHLLPPPFPWLTARRRAQPALQHVLDRPLR